MEASLEELFGAARTALVAHPLHPELQEIVDQHVQGLEDPAYASMVYIQGFEAIRTGAIAQDRELLIAWVNRVGPRSPALLGNQAAVQMVAAMEHAISTMTQWLKYKSAEFDTRCREIEKANGKGLAELTKPSGRAAWLTHLTSVYSLRVTSPLKHALLDLCAHRARAAHELTSDGQVATGEHLKIWLLASQTLVRSIALSAQTMLEDEASAVVHDETHERGPVIAAPLSENPSPD